MPTITPTDVSTSTVSDTDAAVPALEASSDSGAIDRIGIELEYPVAEDPGAVPATRACNSGDLRAQSDYDRNGGWLIDGFPAAEAGSDHVGAEIGSPVLNLHSNEPETWYVESIKKAEQMGFPFAACGYGDTVFGLHFHIDALSNDEWQKLSEMMCEDWARAFFCASVRPNNPSPWRGSGVRSSTFTEQDYSPGHPDGRGPSGHYEFRLPEPGLPDHVSMMFHFFRLMEHEGPEVAGRWAEERVYDRDPRLTAVQQFRYFNENIRRFPEEGIEAMAGRSNDRDYAETFSHEIMGV